MVESGGRDSLLSRLRCVVRLTLPVNAIVAVVDLGHRTLLDLDAASEHSFPSRIGATEGELVDELERIRGQGFHFLLVPVTAHGWLEEHAALKRHLERSCRLVVEEEGTCIVYALQAPADMPARGIAPDGLPAPPPEMVHMSAGLFDFPDLYRRFHESGALGVASIADMLERNRLDARRFRSMLDFGCGCGRLIRHWRSLGGPKLHGCDYNPYLVEWCRANLPFAQFTRNGLIPPLGYDDESFDFVYAISVFTHLSEPLQVPWAAELARVLTPDGVAHVTFHGRGRIPAGDDAPREVFQTGELVVLGPEMAGTSATAAFHPEPYVRDVLAVRAGLDVVDFVPNGQRDAVQDAYLLRRA